MSHEHEATTGKPQGAPKEQNALELLQDLTQEYLDRVATKKALAMSTIAAGGGHGLTDGGPLGSNGRYPPSTLLNSRTYSNKKRSAA